MKRRPPKFDRYLMVSASSLAKARVEASIQLAQTLVRDERKEERLAKQECKACFYYTRVGGASMTTQPCACCGKDEVYASTNTDRLCKACAKEHSLCRHCAGDIDMRPLRRLWPESQDHTKEPVA